MTVCCLVQEGKSVFFGLPNLFVIAILSRSLWNSWECMETVLQGRRQKVNMQRFVLKNKKSTHEKRQ